LDRRSLSVQNPFFLGLRFGLGLSKFGKA